MKKQYVIKFKGLFEHGYVTLVALSGSREIPRSNTKEAIDSATKFRFKFVANFWRWTLEKLSERECDLRTYEVIKLTEN